MTGPMGITVEPFFLLASALDIKGLRETKLTVSLETSPKFLLPGRDNSHMEETRGPILPLRGIDIKDFGLTKGVQEKTAIKVSFTVAHKENIKIEI